MKTILLITIFLSHFAYARELDGVKMADQIEIDGKVLLLNGMGKRTKFVFDVYVGGLYLEAKSSDPAEIVASPSMKRVDLFFLRDVDASKMHDAWLDAVKNNCLANCEKVKKGIEDLNKLITDIKEKQTMSYIFRGDEIEYLQNGTSLGLAKGPALSQVLLEAWIGQKPPNSEIKNGMLGIE